MAITRQDKNRDYAGPVFFAAVAVATWGAALFVNGYVLLGDMVFAPAMHPPSPLFGPDSGTVSVTLIYNLAWAVSRVTGAVLLQKGVLFLMAFLPGYLMYRNLPSRSRWAKLLAGVVYQVNPYVYTRMLMGQWGLLLGYALLPVAVASTIKTVREPSAGSCARTALWLALASFLSLHMGAIALLACAAAGGFELASRRPARRGALALVAVFLLFVMVSAFWLLPAFRGTETTASIGKADLEVFETRSTSRAGTLVSVVGMYGYWKTRLDPLMPRGRVPGWPLFAFGFAALALFGFWSFRRDPERGPLARAMLFLGAAGFLLSLGAAAPLTGWLFRLIYDHVGIFRLFREPQKFVALLALSYAVLGGLAVERMLSGRRRAPSPAGRESSSGGPAKGLAVALPLLALVLLYSFMMFGGLWGQAKAVRYPVSWEQAREVLERSPGDWKVLYLPPYWYMTFDFAGHPEAITSPMPFYFTNRYVRLNALQVGPVQIDRQETDDHVQEALEEAREDGGLGSLLSPLGVRYVLMALNDASTSYRFVERQEDLREVRRWEDLVLLENNAYRGAPRGENGSPDALAVTGCALSAAGLLLCVLLVARGGTPPGREDDDEHKRSPDD